MLSFSLFYLYNYCLWQYKKETYFASRARAKTPAASGAAADVPEWVLVHLPYRSVVAFCYWERKMRTFKCQSTLFLKVNVDGSARIYGNHAIAPSRIKGLDPQSFVRTFAISSNSFFFVRSLYSDVRDAKETAFSALITSVVGFNIVLRAEQ